MNKPKMNKTSVVSAPAGFVLKTLSHQGASDLLEPNEVVCHTSDPSKNGCTDRAAVWVEDLGGPGEPCIRWGPDPPMGMGKFLGENGCPIVKYRNTMRSSVQRRLNR